MRVLVYVCLSAGLLSMHAQPALAQASRKPCRVTVQEFYDWYVPKTLDLHSDPLVVALHEKRSSFSPELVTEIEKAKAKEREQREVWLGSDPILNSQDPSEHYLIGKVTVKANTCWADIHSVASGRKSEKPDVVAELENRKGLWLFVNFHYPNSRNPDNESLLSLLKRLRHGPNYWSR